MSAVRQIGIKMVVDAQSVTTELPRAAREFENLGNRAEQGSARATRSLAQVSMSVRDIVQGAAGLHIVGTALNTITEAITALPRNAFNYSKELEVSQVGMSGILGSMTAMNGQQLQYNQALKISSEYIGKLNDDALRTAANSKELTGVFQALLAPGLSAKMTLEEIRQLTVVGTNAVKSMGLDSTQVVQELRDLVAGGITPASSTLATALGLKDSDIAKAKASSEGLFKFLMDRLQGFKDSSDAFGDTFKGKLEQLQEGATRVAAKGFDPLIVASKAAIDEVSKLFVTISNGGEVVVNHSLVNSLQEITSAAANGMAAGKALIGTLWENRDAVIALAGAWASFKIGEIAAATLTAAGAKHEAAQASRLLAVQQAAEAASNQQITASSQHVTASSRQKVAAYLTELEAKAANAQADVAAQAAELARLATTQEAIVVARADVVAKMESTRVTLAQAEAQLAAARAAGAQSFAFAMAREATQTLTAAQARHAALVTELALLGKQQAAVQTSIAAATTAQTAATTAATAATAGLTAAQGAASVAGRAFGVVMGALGGPVGIAIAAVSALAMWLYKLKNAADDAAGARMKYGRAMMAVNNGSVVEDRDIMAMRAEKSRLEAEMDELQTSGGKGERKSTEFMGTPMKLDLDGYRNQISSVQRDIDRVLQHNQRLTTEAGQTGQTLTLTVAGAEQAWRKSIDGVKTATAIQQEYNDKLSASKQKFKDFETVAKASPDFNPAKLKEAQAEQAQAEKALADERDKQIKSLNGGAAAARTQGIDAEIAATKHGYKLLAAKTADGLAEVDFLRKQDAISESDALERRTALQLADIDAQQATLESELTLLKGRKDAAKKQADVQGELAELAQKRINIEAAAARQQREIDQQAAEALEKRTEGYREAARQAQQSLYVAQLDQKEIGKTGAALGALHQARVEEMASALDRQAVTMDGIDLSGQASAALRAQAQAQRDLAKTQGYNESAKMVADYTRGIKEASEAVQFEQSLAAMSQRDREIALEQYRIAIDLKHKLEEIDAKNPADVAAAARLKADAEAAAAQAKAGVAAKIHVREITRSVEQMDDIFRKGFAEMINNGENVWNAFNKSLRTSFKTSVADELYKAFAQPLIVPVIANIQGLIGSISGGSAESAASTAGNLSSLANGASSAWKLASGGMNVAATAGKSLASSELLAQYGSDAVREMAGQFGAGMMNTASWSGFSQAFSAGGAQMAGAIAGSVLNGFSGYGISKMLSGGYSAGGWVNTAAGIASAIPGIGPIAGLVGGAVNRLFGRKLKDQGIEGQFGGEDGFTGNTYQYYKGGLLRSSKTKRGTLDEDLRQAMEDQFNAMRLGTVAMADSLSLGTSAVNSFTAGIKVSFKGLDEAGIQKALAEEFDKVAESMAAATLGTTAYNRTGETSVEAITRLSGSLVTVNGVLGNLNSTLYTASLAGADMASSLVDLFGDAGSFSAATGSYFQNFYSAQEQRDAAQRALQKQLDAVQLTLPNIDASNAREQYRRLTEAQDLNTEAGRRAWAVLVQGSDAFAGLTQSAEDVAKSVQQAAANLRSSLIGLEGKFTSGGFARQYQAEDAAKTIAGLLADVGIEKEIGALTQTLLSSTSTDVESYFREIWSVLKTDDARQQLIGVTDTLLGLASAATSAASATDSATRRFAESASAALSARTTAGSLLDRIDGAMGGTGTAYALKREQELWTAMATASYTQQIDLAGQLTDSVLSRMQLEQQSADKLADIHRSLRDSIEATRTGSLSPLTLGQKVKEAEDQFNQAVAKARAGDTDAAGEVAGLRQNYLQLAQRYYAASDDYTAIFNATENALTGLAGQMQSEAQRQLAASQGTLSELQRLRDITQAAYAQADRDYVTSSAALEKQAALLTSMDGGIELMGDILKGLPAELAARLQPLMGSNTVIAGVGINGSHANGLERVPFDGYVAKLHRDELVMPAAQADIFRGMDFSGLGSGMDAVVAELSLVRTDLARSQAGYAQMLELLIQITESTGENTAQQLRQAVREVAKAGVKPR